MQPLTDGDPRHLGAYRLLFRLGEGGMGRVYLGRSPGGRTVAVKMVHPGMAGAPGFRERFAREVRASQAVSGAGTVPVVAADAEAAVPWLASAYVPGPSLVDAVYDHGPLPEPALWRLLSGLAEALGTVHAGGLVHRDLKPSNVLLSLDGPLLIDFGIARAADDTGLTGTGLVVGSPGYMSPEQAEGAEVDAASDVFSLGAVLAYAATGRGPFGGGSGPELLFRVVHRDPDLGGVPEEFAAVVGSCLAKEPGQRPPPEALRTRALEEDGGGADWLPVPVATAIARKAEQLLNLEASEDPRADGPDAEPDAVPTTANPSGAPPTAVVTTTDQGRFPGPPPPAPSSVPGGIARTPPPFAPMPMVPAPGPMPYPPPPYAAMPPYGPGPASRQMPVHLRPDPRRQRWVAPWVQGSALGRPLLSLFGVVPMLVLLWIGSDLKHLVLQHTNEESRADMAGYYDWAMENGSRVPLTVLLVVFLIALQFSRTRIQRYPETATRLWVAATAGYWILWSYAVVFTIAWVLAMTASADSEATHDGLFTTAIVTAVALAFNTLVVPFTLIGGLVRLLRGLLVKDISRPAS